MTDIRDVAKMAGVSVSTVSYAFSGKRPISATTYQRIMDAVKKLGYTPNAGARMLRAEHKHIVAISAPLRLGQNRTAYADYFIEFARQEHLRGYDSLLLTAENGVEDIRRVTLGNLADGVVLMDIVNDDIRAAQASTYKRPCVAIGLPRCHENCACIDLDFEKMGRIAIENMVQAGRRRLIFLKGPDQDYRRRSGYRLILLASLRKWAAQYNAEFHEISNGAANQTQYANRVLKAMGTHKANGLISEIRPVVLDAVLGRIAESGLSIPDDVAVMSCAADTPSETLKALHISEMPLTPDTLCVAASDMLTKAIEGNQDVAGQVKLQDPLLIHRQSVPTIERAQ